MEQSKHSQGVTSVKVHHKPGGASNLVLGDYVEPKPAQKQGAVGAPKSEEETKVDPASMPAAGVKTPMDQKKEVEDETKVDTNKKLDPASMPVAGVKAPTN